MRIMHITPAGGYGRVQLGGAERAVAELANGAHALGHHVSVVAPQEFTDQAPLHSGVRIRPTDIELPQITQIRRYIRTEKPDVVVLHLLRGVIFGRLAAILAGRATGIVTNFHNSLEDTFEEAGASSLRRTLVRLVVRTAHRGRHVKTVAISRPNLHSLIKFDRINEKQIKYIPNWVSSAFRPLSSDHISASRRNLGIPTSSVNILFAGRLESQKDPLLAVRVAAELRKQLPSLTLCVAGAGVLEERVRDLATELALPLTLLGHRSNIAEIMAAADLLLVPSVYEGFGRVAIEALSCGTPVAASAADGLVDALAPFGENDAQIVRSTLPEVWAESCRQLLSDPDPTSRSRRHSLAQAKYGESIAIGEYIETYRSVLPT